MTSRPPGDLRRDPPQPDHLAAPGPSRGTARGRVVARPVPTHDGARSRAQSQAVHPVAPAAVPGRRTRRLAAVGDAEGPVPAVAAHEGLRPLGRASLAWLAVKVSPALESFAFLARGVDWVHHRRRRDALSTNSALSSRW